MLLTSSLIMTTEHWENTVNVILLNNSCLILRSSGTTSNTNSASRTVSSNVLMNKIWPYTQQPVHVPDMTYNVFGGTLSLTQSINHTATLPICCLSLTLRIWQLLSDYLWWTQYLNSNERHTVQTKQTVGCVKAVRYSMVTQAGKRT